MDKAKIVITNYHALKRRERMEVSKVGRALLKGRGDDLDTLETEGQMLQRVMPELMSMKRIVVLNDEAHHCYREKVGSQEEDELSGEDKDAAKKNNEAARLWISGIETVKRKLGLNAVYDLSATPFFLRGSGYAEGTLFPLDGLRLLAHGRDRVRNREAAAGTGGRQPADRRHAGLSGPVETRRQGHAQEGAWQGSGARPSETAGQAPDGAGGSLRALPEDL
jgi:hypothetical protein